MVPPPKQIVDFNALTLRIGEDALSKRLMMEARQESDEMKQSLAWVQTFHLRIERVLKLVGLYHRGRRNSTKIQIIENTLHIPNLPAAFEGFRLLQLSDLHLDIDPALPAAVVQALKGLTYDLAVITGDFRCRTIEDYYPATLATQPVIDALKKPTLAVLGNHDPIEIVPHLEARGLRFLVNELYPLKKDGQTLWIMGIDDPHFYQTYDLKALAKALPPGACTLLLAHSPEIAPEAEAIGINAALSGHTHGGQICLPFGIPITTNMLRNKKRSLVAGNWAWGKLRGYTSRGTGCCGVPVRFNCPGEITLHTLTSIE